MTLVQTRDSAMNHRPTRIQTLAFTLCTLCVLCVSSPASAQDLTPRAKAQEKPVVIANPTTHPMSGKAIENGFVYFDKGVIAGFGTFGAGEQNRFSPGTCRVIEGKGMH